MVDSGGLEDRLRVICHLPLNNAKQEQAVFEFFEYMKQLRLNPKWGVQGFTSTVAYPTVFQGWWFSSRANKWVYDKLVVCMIDYAVVEGGLYSEVHQLKDYIASLYKEHAGEEEQVWVVIHNVVRQG